MLLDFLPLQVESTPPVRYAEMSAGRNRAYLDLLRKQRRKHLDDDALLSAF